MDWTIQATVQSQSGIGLFVMPFTICVGWAMERILTCTLNGFSCSDVFDILVVTECFAKAPAGRLGRSIPFP